MEAIALYDFNATAKDELSFKKGSVLKIWARPYDETHWIMAEFEGECGLVPDNYIQFQDYEWYRGRISRIMAEDILSRQSHDGAFLIRECESRPGHYALSLKQHGAVEHYIILYDGAGRYFLGVVKFSSLNKLVDHYRTASVSPKHSIYLRNMEVKVQAEFDFVPHEDDELELHKGDIITVIDKSNKYWWKGICNGKEGLFPSNFVKTFQ